MTIKAKKKNFVISPYLHFLLLPFVFKSFYYDESVYLEFFANLSLKISMGNEIVIKVL